MEDLNIKGMFQNTKWSQKLQKIGLYKLLNMIKYKSEWYGKNIHTNRQILSIKQKMQHLRIPKKNNLTLKIRTWKCPICGTHHHRDINAAKNILNEGLKTQNHTNMWKKIFFHWTHKSMGNSLTNLNTQVLTAQE